MSYINREEAIRQIEEVQSLFTGQYFDLIDRALDIIKNMPDEIAEENRAKSIHDSRFTHADRAEVYERVVKNRKSYVANPDVYARVPLEEMPNPKGEVYRK